MGECTIDDAPAVLAATDLTTADDDGLFGADYGEGNHLLLELACERVRMFM